MSIEEKLNQMGLQIPEDTGVAGNYLPGVKTGNLVFLSGAIPKLPDGSLICGKIGKQLTVEDGQQAAVQVTLNLLSNLKNIIGDLNKIERIIKVNGMINSTSEFEDHPKVLNGCSDLLVQLFEERGLHARSAIGVSSLPFNVAIEIEMVIEVN